MLPLHHGCCLFLQIRWTCRPSHSRSHVTSDVGGSIAIRFPVSYRNCGYLVTYKEMGGEDNRDDRAFRRQTHTIPKGKYEQAFMHSHGHVCTHVQVYIYLHIYIYNSHTYTHIYINTHTYIHYKKYIYITHLYAVSS